LVDLFFAVCSVYTHEFIHPDLFSDMNLEDVNRQINQQFFGISAVGTYCY